jgi:hypothetical protein
MDSDDAQLARALAASMGLDDVPAAAVAPSAGVGVVGGVGVGGEGVDEDEDALLAQAMAASMAGLDGARAGAGAGGSGAGTGGIAADFGSAARARAGGAETPPPASEYMGAAGSPSPSKQRYTGPCRFEVTYNEDTCVAFVRLLGSRLQARRARGGASIPSAQGYASIPSAQGDASIPSAQGYENKVFGREGGGEGASIRSSRGVSQASRGMRERGEEGCIHPLLSLVVTVHPSLVVPCCHCASIITPAIMR